MNPDNKKPDINLTRDRIINKVLDTVNRYRMLQPQDSVLISLSGGPDSIFLANFFCLIKDVYNLKLYCFHLDHKTRDGQSAKDARFVEKFCRRHRIVLFRKEVDAKEWAHERKMTFQEGARTLRLKLLQETAKKNSLKKIATGHDADDNVETFFMHLLRGAGMKGLAGIKPVDGKFIRPLIETSREDILAYLKKNNLDFCVDSTNLDNVYFRNKIRNLLIPCISKNITGADFKKRIANTIKILREENDLLSQLAESFINDLKTASSIGADGKEVQGKEPEDEKTGKKGTYGRGIGGGKTCGKYLEIPLKKLENYPDAFKKRIIISAIEKIKGTSEDIKSISLDRILKFCFSGGESKKIKFSGDLNIIKESDGLAFFLKREKKKKSLTRYAVPQEIEFAGAGTWSRIASENGNETTLALKKLKLKFVSKVIAGNLNTIKNKRISDREAYLDYGKIKFPVFVGFYREGSGQKFVPLGMKNEKKLHDFFIDEKIPKSMRSEIPVFYDREKVIWLGGYRIDERARLDDSTKKIFNIKIIKI